MKNMKKLVVLILSVLMVLGTSVVTSFAATVTITQNNDDGTAGAETYNLYKIFDAKKTNDFQEPATSQSTLGPGTQKGISYTISTSNPWFAKLGTVTDGTWAAASGQTWVTLAKQAGSDTVYNVTWAGENTEAAAKAFATWLKNNKGDIAADKTMTSSNKTATETVADGYYLIDSSLGTNLVLATSNITINTKNQYPSTTKTVAKTNYNVGDFVKYTITVNLPATVDYTKPVTVHDTMDNVLRLVSATTGDDHAWSAKVGPDDFTTNVTLSTGKTNNHDSSTHAVGQNQVGYDFVLDITSLAPAAGSAPTAKTVTIEYYAELMSTAAADTGYVNKEFVEYSKYTTPDSDTEVKTFDFQLKKTFGGEIAADLEATFELTDSTGATIQFIKDRTGYVKKDSDDTGASATLTVKGDATGINVRGLAAGTYTLTEKTTAAGYNLLTTPITVTIDKDGNSTVSDGGDIFSATDNTITVNNQTGTELPSTGGMGTTILYIVGGVLVAVSAIMLVAKKRTSDK